MKDRERRARGAVSAVEPGCPAEKEFIPYFFTWPIATDEGEVTFEAYSVGGRAEPNRRLPAGSVYARNRVCATGVLRNPSPV